MKEKFDTETIMYKTMKFMYPHHVDESYSVYETKLVFEKLFPKEYITWERTMMGGNDGIHKCGAE
jgi:hypothetical protein